jgi:hypothetical protein
MTAATEQIALPVRGPVLATDEEVVLYGGKGLRPYAVIQEALKKPIPDKYLEKRESYKGGPKLTYWPWQVGVMAFDKIAPGWSMKVDGIVMGAGHIAVMVSVFIPCLENPYPGVFRSGTGGDYEHMDEAKRAKGFDPVLDAERQAMKRAMSNHGFGLYLYG